MLTTHHKIDHATKWEQTVLSILDTKISTKREQTIFSIVGTKMSTKRQQTEYKWEQTNYKGENAYKIGYKLSTLTNRKMSIKRVQ